MQTTLNFFAQGRARISATTRSHEHNGRTGDFCTLTIRLFDHSPHSTDLTIAFDASDRLLCEALARGINEANAHHSEPARAVGEIIGGLLGHAMAPPRALKGE